MPYWFENVLETAVPAILNTHGEGFLPAGGDELGCGGFGCVVACRQPGLVCKVTIDGSEAMFADVAQAKGWNLPGLPRWAGQPLHMDRPGPVWLLWRQDIPDRPLSAYVSERYQALRKQYKPFSKEHMAAMARDGSSQQSDHLEQAQQNGLAISSYLFDRTCNAREHTSNPIRDLLNLRAWAESQFSPVKHGISWTYHKGKEELSHLERAAIGVLAYDWHLEQVAMGRLAPALASSLRLIAKRGLMLGDCSASNIASSPVPTLFDCGFCIPLKTHWLGAWEEAGADMCPWWNHNEREKRLRAWI